MIQNENHLVAKHGESSFGADSFSNNFDLASAHESASEQVIAANTYPMRNGSSHVIDKEQYQEDIVPNTDCRVGSKYKTNINIMLIRRLISEV